MAKEIDENKVVIFSGAGISAESGIPTFRDAGGLWEQYSIAEVATPKAWLNNPSLVLYFYNHRRRQIANCQPNEAHLAIARLENAYETIVDCANLSIAVIDIALR